MVRGVSGPIQGPPGATIIGILTRAEVAYFLGVELHRVVSWTARGFLPSIALDPLGPGEVDGPGRPNSRFVRQSDLDAFIRRHGLIPGQVAGTLKLTPPIPPIGKA